jgi:hypothetical protein
VKIKVKISHIVYQIIDGGKLLGTGGFDAWRRDMTAPAATAVVGFELIPYRTGTNTG